MEPVALITSVIIANDLIDSHDRNAWRSLATHPKLNRKVVFETLVS